MTYLTRPLETRRLYLKNRLVIPPMATSKGHGEGTVSEELLHYYSELTRGGYPGLVILEHCYVHPSGRASSKQLSISKDSDIEGLKKISDLLHAQGVKSCVQLNHAGSATFSKTTGCEIMSASPIANVLRETEIPREMDQKDIQSVIEWFGQAALRGKNAGFDAVEIHSAHGYLLNQFYSPLMNKRQDEYGGDVAGRIRLHLEIIDRVRKEVGEDFPILLRLGALDYMEGGSTLEDIVAAAKAFEERGVEIIDISGGMCGFIVKGIEGEGYFWEASEAIRKSTELPTILTGGIISYEGAEELLVSGKADLIGVGRALAKDPDIARRMILQSRIIERERALEIAHKAHTGQADKSGKPYIQHPLTVAEAFEKGSLEEIVAILHDVIEDSDTTAEDLLNWGISPEAVKSVEILSKREGEDYFDYISRVKESPLCIAVKLQDLKHNMDLSRFIEKEEKMKKKQEKYRKAYEILTASK